MEIRQMIKANNHEWYAMIVAAINMLICLVIFDGSDSEGFIVFTVSRYGFLNLYKNGKNQ